MSKKPHYHNIENHQRPNVPKSLQPTPVSCGSGPGPGVRRPRSKVRQDARVLPRQRVDHASRDPAVRSFCPDSYNRLQVEPEVTEEPVQKGRSLQGQRRPRRGPLSERGSRRYEEDGPRRIEQALFPAREKVRGQSLFHRGIATTSGRGIRSEGTALRART